MTPEQLQEKADSAREDISGHLLDEVNVHTLFTGTSCAETSINSYKFVGYGNTHTIALDDMFGQIRYAKSLKLI